MAYTYRQKAIGQDLTGASANAIATGTSIEVTTGDTIIVPVFFYGDDTAVTITDTLGNTYTMRGPEIASGSSRLRRFSAVSQASGSNIVTANFAANRAYRCVSAEAYSGVGAFQTASGQLQTNPGTTANALTSTQATPSVQPALQWGVCMRIELETYVPAAGTGFNSRAAMWGEARTEDRRVTSLAPTAATFTSPNTAVGNFLVGQLLFSESDPLLSGTASSVAAASAALTTQIRVAANAAAMASGSAAIATAIRLAMSAIGVAAASGLLTTGVRLSADARAEASAQGALAAGAVMQAVAANVVNATAALATEIRLGGVASASAGATGALINWASVTLSGSLYEGPGGVLDPNFWLDSKPTLGTTVYYDPTNLVIYPNGEISSSSNDCVALVMFFDGTSWARGVIVVTPHLVAYANAEARATAELGTAIQLAAAASALATASGAFSTGAGLGAAAAGSASASGTLSTAIPVSALAAAVVSSVAALTTQINLLAAAGSVSSATAALDSATFMNAAAAALSSVTASITTSIRVAGSASGVASAGGALTTGLRLDAVASDVASAAGELSSAIVLVANASSSASASAGLTAYKPLLAAAIDVATAFAILSTGVSLRGDARAVSSATASLSAEIELLAQALSEATATAVLTDVITTPPIGVYTSDPRYVVAKTRWCFFGRYRAARFNRKAAGEKVILTFDFSGVMQDGETLDGPITLTIEATSGTDENARDLFNGYPAYDMTKRKILVPVKGGLRGRRYYVTVEAATTNQQKSLELSGLLPIKW